MTLPVKYPKVTWGAVDTICKGTATETAITIAPSTSTTKLVKLFQSVQLTLKGVLPTIGYLSLFKCLNKPYGVEVNGRDAALHPLHTFAIASVLQQVLKTWTTFRACFLLLKCLRMYSPTWNRHVGSTYWSWHVMFLSIGYSMYQPEMYRLYDKSFNKIVSSFTTIDNSPVRPINQKNIGVESSSSSSSSMIHADFCCDPLVYHPGTTCSYNLLRMCLYNLRRSALLYPAAYTVFLLLSSKGKLTPSSFLRTLASYVGRSSVYAMCMLLSNRAMPCAMRYIDKHPHPNLFHPHPLRQMVFSFLYMSVGAYCMFRAELPARRTSIFDFTASFILSNIVQRVFKQYEPEAVSVVTGTAFTLTHLQVYQQLNGTTKTRRGFSFTPFLFNQD